MQTRIATLNDVNLLVQLGRETFYETFLGTCTDADMKLFLNTSFDPDKVVSEIEDPQSRFLILEGPDGAIGYSRLMGEADARVELVRFYMASRAIGTGAAHVLMEQTLELARSMGYVDVYLGVWENNLRAQKFYRKWGFEKTGEKVFMVGTDPQTDWYFERRL